MITACDNTMLRYLLLFDSIIGNPYLNQCVKTSMYLISIYNIKIDFKVQVVTPLNL